MDSRAAPAAQLLFEASQALLAIQDLPGTLQTIAAKTRALLGTTHAQILLWDEAAQTLSLGAADGRNVGVCDRLQYGLDRGVCGVVARSRQPLIVNDYQSWPHRFAGRSDEVAEVGVPLFAHGRFLGVLTSCSTVPGTQFTAHHIHLLGAFAAQAAVAIEYARLREAAEREIGAHRQAEAALRERETRLRLSVEASNVGLWDWDLRTNTVYFSPEWKRQIGYRDDEISNRFDEWQTRVHPDDLDRSFQTVRAFIEKPWPGYQLEFRFRHKDGSYRWMLAQASLLRDERGIPIRMLGSHVDVTESKQAQEALRASEEKFRSLFNNAEVGMFRTRLDGSAFLDMNDKYLSILGRTREEVIGKSTEIHWADPEEREELVKSLKAKGRVNAFECRLLNKAGEVLNCLMSLRLDPETGILEGSTIDITARKRAEEALRIRTAHLDAVRETTADILRELDLSRLLDLILTRAIALTRTASGTLFLWDEPAQLLAPAVNHGLGEWYRAVRLRPGEGVAGRVAQRRAGMIENDYQHSTYVLPWIQALHPEAARVRTTLAEPLLYQGRLLGVLLVRDIVTGAPFDPDDAQLLRLFADQAAVAIENARLHQATVRRSAELQALLRATRSVMSGLDLQEILDRIVVQAQQITGAPHVKVLLLDRPAGCLRVGAAKGTASRQGETLPLDSGVSATVARTGEPLYSANHGENPQNPFATRDRELGVQTYLGLPIKKGAEVLGVLTFNTTTPKEYSHAELAYLASFADQAAIAIENARLYAELKASFEQLQRAQAELVRTEQLRGLGQMAAGIAHDLNNTLATVLGQVELAKLAAPPPALRDVLACIETAAADGAATVRRIQDFARPRGTSPLRPCDLAAVVREVIEITRPRWKDALDRRGVRVDIGVVMADLPPILGCAPELREALTNLIFNAVDAMPHGGTLTFQGTATATSVTLTVTDTGIGMPPEIQTKVFEPFFTTKGAQGTGLGLAIVYGILERHGGSITVASTPQRGTTFTLTFQRARDADAPVALAIPAPVLPASRRVLVVDDDAGVRRTLVHLLTLAGHSVLEAPHGPSALETLATTPVDVVCTDLGMPGMSGWDLARRIKAGQPRLPVVLLTGWQDQAPGDDFDREGVDAILWKPVKLQDLLQAIEKVVGETA